MMLHMRFLRLARCQKETMPQSRNAASLTIYSGFSECFHRPAYFQYNTILLSLATIDIIYIERLLHRAFDVMIQDDFI